MAPTIEPPAIIALSHVAGVSDGARARELYKYFQPSEPVNSDTCFPASIAPVPAPASGTGTRTGPVQQAEDEPPRHVPVKSNITAAKVASPDTALTAFCQLVTWRTGSQRAMIGLIDAKTQYFVAESTKTVDLFDTASHATGDDIWMGCSSVSKTGKLCEKTIAVKPSPNNSSYPSFVVNDLSKDECFNQLPFVTGPPNLRFYAGVPLITEKGIPIGSLFVVDDQVRDGMSKENIHFMGTMAQTIMKHLEMVRGVEEHRRSVKMSRGLASFVEGRAELLEAEVDVYSGEGTKIAGQFASEPPGFPGSKPNSPPSSSITAPIGSPSSVDRRDREHSHSTPLTMLKSEQATRTRASPDDKPDSSLRPPEYSTPESQGTSLGTATSGSIIWSRSNYQTGSSADVDLSETSSQKRLFSRAAHLIHDTFEVDGGCIFYDAQAGIASDHHDQPSSPGHADPLTEDSQTESQATSGDEFPTIGENASLSHDPNNAPAVATSQAAMSPDLPAAFSRTSRMSKKPAEILGFSTPAATSVHGDALPGPQLFKPFQEKALDSLLRRYPRGKLWTFDSDGGVTSSEEEEEWLQRPAKHPVQPNKDVMRRKARTVRAKSDAKFLSKHFPGVRQLLFVPLWDAGRSRWLSGCFVWSTELSRVFSKQSELSFLTAFANSVMAEWSRIDTEIANRKKGDFIGSISHELRSPLHGILASAEFLSDEVQSTFETSMVETISSCGRTLLDTINHVLDFSKINHFESTWRKSRRGIPRSASGVAIKQSELPMINLYADIDVSVVCEEVVEGIFAGHIFHSGNTTNFDMTEAPRKTMPVQLKGPLPSQPEAGSGAFQQPEVAVIFDVDQENYQFTTQPGAFRRVVMNLLGNALKYTSHGYVRVKLTTAPIEDFQDLETGEVIPRAMVTLTVSDTGKGISPEFLRSKLFTPFAQENALSSGTGLGLSIVKSIVHILEGDITIESEVGRGTQVRVSLPLLRWIPNTLDHGSVTNARSVASAAREPEESISKLRCSLLGQRVTLHGFDIRYQDPVSHKMSQLLKISVMNFLTNWYGLQVVPFGQKAELIISNEGNPADISNSLPRAASTRRKLSVIILCSHSSRVGRVAAGNGTKLNVGYVTTPVGPLKLAKAIVQCMQGSNTPTPGPMDGASTGSKDHDLSNTFEEMSLSPAGGEVLDNSRMAAVSDNARNAIESPTPNALFEKASEFPFPDIPGRSTTSKAKDMSEVSKSAQRPSSRESTGTLPQSPNTSRAGPKEDVPMTRPSFLLVDDNAINLTLLSTSIGKRKHNVIDRAMDGLAAVKKFLDRQEGYDVIFMDISMPLLDGFGATKQIRAIEASRKDRSRETGEYSSPVTPALVIAITGLASSDDQAQAANVGVDLFLTKPVSFRDVNKMLDNWEANREKDTTSSSI
ncbi:ATPase of HSP90 chaperone topoisomerase II kinase [Venustampulla echinocandica]|uniref:histidine kinase n=1 Tax=Venustampulla echinocandica TaxID=2656787 RepID=A0A370TJC2_9HELO|nr:ATPase of HSP90 chaperone topoisomerase II kinase [Venustampulla echinocandica]RDL35459.1 ATPase of HSP90 chaperone topoisomerase II kinase [Venustampulla echinocandica]